MQKEKKYENKGKRISEHSHIVNPVVIPTEIDWLFWHLSYTKEYTETTKPEMMALSIQLTVSENWSRSQCAYCIIMDGVNL